ncbi:MAG: hypothetical protein SFY68_11415 [Candidatus Sumerlaeia bacterium]|nr:hypothetical protein [Candidatus Sumerlaeia bacterium]
MMPHLVFQGSTTLEDIFLGFSTLEFREKGTVGKALECFINKEKSVLLIRCLLVERGLSTNFLLKIAHGSGATNPEGEVEFTLGLETIGSPERTEGLKRFLGYCCWVLMQTDPQLKVLRGNIHEYVKGMES